MHLGDLVHVAGGETFQRDTVSDARRFEGVVAQLLPRRPPFEDGLAAGDAGVPRTHFRFRPSAFIRNRARSELKVDVPVALITAPRRTMDGPLDRHAMQFAKPARERFGDGHTLLMAQLMR